MRGGPHGHGRFRPDPFGDGEPGEMGRGGRRRVFDSNSLRLVLLTLLEDQPRHGYDLIRAIEARSNGAYAPSPGVVYPTLTLLDDQDHIRAAPQQEGAKRLYEITADGRAHLDANRAEAQAAMARLDALGVEHSRTDAGPVWRAMTNLKMALRQRIGRDPHGRDVLFDVAAIIDEAARKIERLETKSNEGPRQ
jgi:DNA-binding PadR family transcriptional regulator